MSDVKARVLKSSRNLKDCICSLLLLKELLHSVEPNLHEKVVTLSSITFVQFEISELCVWVDVILVEHVRILNTELIELEHVYM